MLLVLTWYMNIGERESSKAMKGGKHSSGTAERDLQILILFQTKVYHFPLPF